MPTDFNTFSVESLYVRLVHLFMPKIKLQAMHLPVCSVTWCNSAILISDSLRKTPSIILLCALHMYMVAADEIFQEGRGNLQPC